ncbi:bifunctional nuclease family protein [Chloroflexota bacterium]
MGKLSKAKWCLSGCLIIVFLLTVSSFLVPDRLTGTIEWLANNDFAGRMRTLTTHNEIHQDSLIEMVVENVGVSEINYQPVVILKEKSGELYLPIWIGLAEATAISVVLDGIEVPRPLTPDLLHSIIAETGADIDYIIVNDIQNGTFYASIFLNNDWTQTEIDARPSDAIAIALRVKAPIYATKTVLEKAAVPSEQRSEKYTTISVR